MTAASRRGRLVSAARGPVLVDEADHRRALADRGRAALDRPGADVAGGVDAGDAGLEQALGARLGAGQHEPLVVAGDDVAEPVGARDGAEEAGTGTTIGSRSPSVSVTASSAPSAPWSSAISLRSRTATP